MKPAQALNTTMAAAARYGRSTESDQLTSTSVLLAPSEQRRQSYSMLPATRSKCSCRYSDGMWPTNRPKHVVAESEDAPLCAVARVKYVDADDGKILEANSRKLDSVAPDATIHARTRAFFLDLSNPLNNVDSNTAELNAAMVPQRQGPMPSRVLYLFGDSLSEAGEEAFIAATRGTLQVINIGLASPCGFRDPKGIKNNYKGVPGDISANACSAFQDAIMHSLRRYLRAGDIVAILQKVLPLTDENYDATYFSTELLEITKPRGATLLLLGGWPAHGVDPGVRSDLDVCQDQLDTSMGYQAVVSCLPTFIQPTVSPCCTVSGPGHAYTDRARAYKSLELAHPGQIYFFDLYPLLCNDDSKHCTLYLPGTHVVAYKDTLHVNYEGSISLWPFICDYMDEQGLL